MPDFEPPVTETPPTRRALQDINTPNQTDGFWVELVNLQDSALQKVLPIKRGTPYASVLGSDQRVIDQYAGNPLYFLKQTADIVSMRVRFNGQYDEYVLWIWATDSLAQDTYNSEVTYDEDGVAYPIFQREYDIRRKDWEANPTLAEDSTLTGLLSVAITNPGTGYTQASGTITGGATVEFVCFQGHLIDGIVTKQGSSIVDGGTLIITGDGTGGAATARIQPATAYLISQKKSELPEDNPKSHDYVRVIRIYATMPGPALHTTLYSEQIRGRLVTTTIQKGLKGTLPPESGDNILSSETQEISDLVEQRTTKGTGELPPDEKYAFWEYAPLPLLLFDVTNVVFCNDSQFFTIVSNPTTAFGSSVLRKHRVTVAYHNSYPNPDLSGAQVQTNDIRYVGKFVQFSYNNVLNDELSYSEICSTSSGDSSCTWTEEYDFAASYPSATDFAAGMWIVRDFQVEFWGESGFKSKLTEYYSAPGSPAI